MMDTRMKFNLEIDNVRQMYTTVILVMNAAGKVEVFRVPTSPLALVCFQAAVYSGCYAHAALLSVSDVVVVWHRDAAVKQQAPEKPAYAFPVAWRSAEIGAQMVGDSLTDAELVAAEDELRLYS